MDLSIIIVSWNVRVLLRECLNSIFSSLKGGEFEVIVVDNASEDGSVEMVRQGFPQVRLLLNETNEGFAKANNRALRIMKEDFALLLNPDTVVKNGAVDNMLEFMRKNGDVGILGCKITNSDGSPQPSAFSFPTLMDDIILGLGSNLFFTGRLISRYRTRAKHLPDNPRPVDWVTGACLMIRRKTMEDIGFMDDRLFLFAEDLDWCLRAKRRGWKVMYLPSACVIHRGGESTKKNLEMKIWSFYFKRFHFAQKYRGIPSILTLKFVSFLELLAKMIIVGMKKGLDQRERRSRLAGYKKAMKLVFQKLGSACR